MGSVDDISQLCRLCLVKDQVNIPIFDGSSEIGQTFVKINSCLPVKVSRDDNLPKKICDGCSYKLDMLYIFRNTSVDSEKQLISWLSQSGLSTISQAAAKDPLANAKPEIMVKQETFDSADSRVEGDNPDMGVDAQNYILQQQQLPYQQDFEFGEPSGSIAEMTDEPTPKRAKRAAALKKAPIEDIEETEDDLDAAMQITKAEEEDSEDVDQPDYVEAPSTSADDQPGPSGVGKAPVEAPPKYEKIQNGNHVEYKCTCCAKTVETLTQLHSHLRVHKPKKQFVCPICNQVLSRVGLYRHKTYLHSEKRNFKCNICDYSCSEKHTLKNHMIGMHTKDYPFKCTECDAGYLSKPRLEAHQKTQHEGFRWKCKFCDKTFSQLDGVRAHEMFIHHHSDSNAKKRNRSAKTEVESHTCSVCSKVLVNKTSLKAHMDRHNGVRLGCVCEICGAVLASKQGLIWHQLTHTGEKNYVCHVCGKKCTKKNLLDQHMLVHTKEKPYECEYCNKRFTQRSSLTIHKYQHTQMPYKCEICGKTFARRNLFQKHHCAAE